MPSTTSWGPALTACVYALAANLVTIPFVVLLWSLFKGDPISHEVERLRRTVDAKELIDESGLYRYFNHICDVPTEEWYEHIGSAQARIWLMSPSLIGWFRDQRRIKELLIAKAIAHTDIRLVIMGPENDSCRPLAEAQRTYARRADVSFYEVGRLRDNEEKLSGFVRATNEEIKVRSGGKCEHYIQLKKVVSGPIFVKAEFFGDTLHWSVFGYDLDGHSAPSFWCDRRHPKDSDPPEAAQGLYNVIREEFETIWEDESVTSSIDVSPAAEAAPSNA